MSIESSPSDYAFTALNLAEAATLDTFFEQLFPADEYGPGASSIGVIRYLDRALSGPYAHHLETYRLGGIRVGCRISRSFRQTIRQCGFRSPARIDRSA